MEAFVLVASIGVALLLAELLLPTGGVLAALGAFGLVIGGLLAFGSDTDSADAIGAGLITLGILSGITFYFVARKVIAAHRDEPVRGGTEEMIDATAEARTSIDPEGQVWVEGALWRAQLADGSEPVRVGGRVTIEAVEGLTLVVRSQSQSAEPSKEGAG